jgi:hypothetical protein
MLHAPDRSGGAERRHSQSAARGNRVDVRSSTEELLAAGSPRRPDEVFQSSHRCAAVQPGDGGRRAVRAGPAEQDRVAAGVPVDGPDVAERAGR